MLESTIIIAFDQHAATTVAAVLLPQHRTPALHSLTSDISTIQRFVARVKRQGAVRFCYEAGPCGFELQRALTARALVRRIGRVTFEHVRREFNKDADRLANEAMDAAQN